MPDYQEMAEIKRLKTIYEELYWELKGTADSGYAKILDNDLNSGIWSWSSINNANSALKAIVAEVRHRFDAETAAQILDSFGLST